jgi:hypothetical protein
MCCRFGFLVIAWLLAFTLPSVTFLTLANQIQRSAVLDAVNEVMPTSVSELCLRQRNQALRNLVQRAEPRQHPPQAVATEPRARSKGDGRMVS